MSVNSKRATRSQSIYDFLNGDLHEIFTSARVTKSILNFKTYKEGEKWKCPIKLPILLLMQRFTR